MNVKMTIDRKSLSSLKLMVVSLLTNGCPPLVNSDDLHFDHAISYRQHLLILDTWFAKYLRKNEAPNVKMKVGVTEALALLWLMANWNFFENSYIGAILAGSQQELTNLIHNTIQSVKNDTGVHLHQLTHG